MNMDTNLQGRLRNTTLPLNHGLLPMYEAVINSVHAIEEASISMDEGNIKIEIVRDFQEFLDFEDENKKPGPEALKPIIGFRITDNGIGFTDINMKSFLTLDSDYKKEKGGRGVGRLLWLKAFKKAKIDSVFLDNKLEKISRKFLFSAIEGVSKETNKKASPGTKAGAIIHLEGFKKKYRDASPKTTTAIANGLFEHCLWYFVRQGGAPRINVIDNEETISLDEVYEKAMASSAIVEEITIKGRQFNLTHVRLRTNTSHSHVLALCAAMRLVTREKLTSKIPGLFGKLKDQNGEFMYSCYVTSSYLDETVRSERTGFNIMEDPGELFNQTEISLSDIREEVINKAEKFLSEYLEDNKTKAKERIEKFVAQKAPRYRPILSRIKENEMNVDPEISDRDLDIALHKQLSRIESQLLADGHDIVNPRKNENDDEYQKRLQEYLKTAEDIKKSDLANYVFHRKVILDILAKAIQRKPDGKYAKEDIIHNLIMPMRQESNALLPDSANLWLLDERLAFHELK